VSIRFNHRAKEPGGERSDEHWQVWFAVLCSRLSTVFFVGNKND